MEPENLRFMTPYFKNMKAYEIQNRHAYSAKGPGQANQFYGQRSKSQGHISRIAKTCRNSVFGGHINFTTLSHTIHGIQNVMSHTIINAVSVSIVNVITFYRKHKYYTEKSCVQSTQCCITNAL